MTPFISDSPPSFFPSLFSPSPPSSHLLPLYSMSFSTNFQPLFQHSGDHYYDNIYSSFPQPPSARAQVELARLDRALMVPEFTDSTPSTSSIGMVESSVPLLAGPGRQRRLPLYRGLATVIVITGFIFLVWMM